MAYGGTQANPVEEHLKFAINSSITVTVVSGDITQMQADGVVIGETNSFAGWGYVALAIARVGGNEYKTAKDAMINQVPFSDRGTDRVQPVYWCSAGSKLKYKRVYHAIFPSSFHWKTGKAWQADVAGIYTKVCADADTKYYETSLVAPILGSGGLGVGTFEDATWATLNGIRAYHALSIRDVILVEKDSRKAKTIVDVCHKWMGWQKTKYNNNQVRVIPLTGGLPGTSATGHAHQHQVPSSSLSSGLHGPGSNHSQRSSNFSSGYHGSGSSYTQPSSSLSGNLHGSGSDHKQPWSQRNRRTSPTRSGQQGRRGGEDPELGLGSGDQSAGAAYSFSNSRSSPTFNRHSWRDPQKQATKKEEDTGNFNYHMRKVAEKTQERRNWGEGRGGHEYKESTTAMLTENSFGGRGSQGHTAGLRGDYSEHQQNHRRFPHDDREISDMEVDEHPGPTSGFTQNHGKPELQNNEPNPNPPNIVVLSSSSWESSDDETSPHPGTERQTRTARWESGTSAHLSKTGSHQAASPPTEPSDTRVPTETGGYKESKNARNLLEENFPSLCSSVGLSGTGSNSSASRENFGRYRTSGSPASRTFSSISKPEENSYGTQDRGYSSLGSPSLSTTSSTWTTGHTSGHHGATGNRWSPLYASMGAIEGKQQFLPDREFSSLGSSSRSSSSRNLEGDGISGHQGMGGSQPSSRLSMSITEGRQRSGQNRDFGNMRPLSHSGAGSTLGSFDKSSGNHRSLSFDDEHSSMSSSGSNVRGAESTSAVSRQTSRGESYGKEGATAGNGSAETSAWETIEERTESSPDGKMVVTRNNRIQLDGCSVLVLEFSFPNGVQGPQHPAPGQPYKGTFRRAFLPDNRQGREVLGVLRQAFRRNLVFTIWNDSNEDLVETEPDIKLLTSHRDHCDSGYLEKLRSVLSQKMSY